MATDNTRRQNNESSIGRIENENSVGGTRLLKQLAAELFGAIEDHRKWIDSDRARALGTTFEVTGRLLGYGAYLALAYLSFTSYLQIRKGIAAGIYTIPGEVEGSRVALFNILATGLVGPIVIIAIGVAVGWIYNLSVASANRLLPRFVKPLVHPSLMFLVVATFGVYHSTISSSVARGYLYAQANIEAASPQQSNSEKAVVTAAPGVAVIADRDASSERELVRLKSMFNNRRSCSKDDLGSGLSPQAEPSRPEPGLAPSSDCQAEKQTSTDDGKAGAKLHSAIDQ
jgi:hypothetical protein